MAPIICMTMIHLAQCATSGTALKNAGVEAGSR